MKKTLPFLLLGAAGLLFCFGVIALAINFWGARTPSVDLTKWRAPSELVDTRAINPALTLLVLAGTPDALAVEESLAAGDWEGAFADIAYSTEFSDANRAGTLLLLGSRYAAAKQLTKAAWAYHYAVFVATVSPLPSDLNRAQTLLEAAQGFKALQLDMPARAALDQAYLIAQYSFAIPRDTRADLLEQIARTYDAFGIRHLAREARQRSGEQAMLTREDAINTARRPFRLQPTDPPENPELNAKLQARIAAARELIDALNLNPPANEFELPEDLIRALGDQLYEEDGLRAAYYAEQYDQALDASTRLGILRDKIRWLALKYRIARLGFGLSLLPEWESDIQAIVQELNDTYAEFFQITEQQAMGLEKSDEADRSVEDVLRASIVAGRWGLYPQYDEAELRARLDEVSQRLRDQQILTLRLDSYTRDHEIVYLLVPDELYGQGERARPR